MQSGKLKKPNGSAIVKIVKDLKSIQDEPVEGVFCEFVDESDVFEWRIFFEGPEGTPYQGGIFEARMTFPQDYPMSPPSLTIMSEFWHPNVYKDGRVCISILHSPGNDPMSGELPEERWMPTQTVSTIMLSFQSMLSDPNLASPANLDASLMFRDKRKEFNERTSKLVEVANLRVPQHVVIPHPDTDPVQREKVLEKMKRMNEINTFSIHNMEDSDDMDDEDLGDSEDETSLEVEEEYEKIVLADCPVCKATMIEGNKGYAKCLTCTVQFKNKVYICGRKCYVLDCGEITPSGTCDNPITASTSWKCEKKIHKDDKNAEDNFLETMV